MKQPVSADHVKMYNSIVKDVYFTILKKSKLLLSGLERSEYRHTLTRVVTTEDSILHELLNPILYLRLECHSYGIYKITWGFEQLDLTGTANDFSYVTSQFIRLLYKLSAKEVTPINIEASVRTDIVQTLCSEFYDYTEEHSKNHIYKLIAYRPAASKRKLISVA